MAGTPNTPKEEVDSFMQDMCSLYVGYKDRMEAALQMLKGSTRAWQRKHNSDNETGKSNAEKTSPK